MFKRRINRFCVLIILNYLIINTTISDVKGMKSKKILYGLALASILNMGQNQNQHQMRHPIPLPYPIPIQSHQSHDKGCSHPHCDHHYHSHHHHNRHHHYEINDYHREDSYPMSEGYEFESNGCNGCKSCNNY